MRSEIMVAALGAMLLAGCASVTPGPAAVDLQRQVADTERAFAKTMADRDHAAFATFLSDETIFFSGAKALRGTQQVAEAWKRFYDGPAAPFSWQPEVVEVLASGTLALSSGPVRNPQGKLVATFTSIWRLEAPGTWRIVFDKGNEVCDCAKP
jgi:ketosteroid isomerase-like protein